MKAKARQQKLLAQMSSSQRAFLLNPSNKEDVDAFKGIFAFKLGFNQLLLNQETVFKFFRVFVEF